jgi:nucleotide-binding universal stress UspA family protein
MSRKILVPIDLEHGEHVDEVLRIAAKLAASGDAQVELLTVIEAAPVIVSQYLPESYEAMASSKAEQDLAALAAGLGAAADRWRTTVRFGGTYQEILAHAEKVGADLIVIGSHKPNVADYLLGSTAARVVRHARCSVYVVR